MQEIKKIMGIDISKDVFDVKEHKGDHFQFNNDEKGFKKFVKLLDKSSHCVMESTGVYHVQLAMFLHKKGYDVSVVNPLRIKRYGQMQLRNLKTDKADAELIAQFAVSQHPDLWHPPEDYIRESRELFELSELYIKHRTALKNRLHAVETREKGKVLSKRKLQQSIQHMDGQIEDLEKVMMGLVISNEQALFSRLKSIPGLGKKTALFLILITEGFSNFENAKQLSNFIGLAPMHHQSGSSVRGRSRISKQGNPKIRNLLFMCSFNACKYNKACKELYDRIVAKGKSKKLALIAVANKLVKQAFAIAKSGLNYDQEYRGVCPSL